MTRLRYSDNPNTVVKTALLHAIDERESFVDGHRRCTDPDFLEAVKLAEKQINDYRLMLKRRFRIDYAGTLGEIRRQAGKSIPIDQVPLTKK